MKKILAYPQKESVMPAVPAVGSVPQDALADQMALQIRQMSEIVGQNMAKLNPFQQGLINFMTVQQAEKIMPLLLSPKANVGELLDKMKDEVLLASIQNSSNVAKVTAHLSPNIKHTKQSVTFQFSDKTEKSLSDKVDDQLHMKFKNVNRVLIKIVKDAELSETNRKKFQDLMYGDLQDENHPGDLLFVGIANVLRPDGLMQVMIKEKMYLINIRLSEIQHDLKVLRKEMHSLEKRKGSEKQIKELTEKQSRLLEKVKSFQTRLVELKQESVERNQLAKRVYANINLMTQQIYYLLKKPLKLSLEDIGFLNKLLGEDFVAKKIACHPLYQEKKLDLKGVQQYLNGKSVSEIKNFGIVLDKMYLFPKKLSQEEKELLIKLLGESFVRKHVHLPKHKQ